MENTNITTVSDAAINTTDMSASVPKHKWLENGCRFAKKAVMMATVAGVMASTCITQVFADATGIVDT